MGVRCLGHSLQQTIGISFGVDTSFHVWTILCFLGFPYAYIPHPTCTPYGQGWLRSFDTFRAFSCQIVERAWRSLLPVTGEFQNSFTACVRAAPQALPPSPLPGSNLGWPGHSPVPGQSQKINFFCIIVSFFSDVFGVSIFLPPGTTHGRVQFQQGDSMGGSASSLFLQI